MIKKIIKRLLIKKRCLGKNVKFHFSSDFGLNTQFEGNNRIGENSFFNGEMGRCSYIGENSRIDGKVGRYCSIASEVKTVYGKHPSTLISTSPVFYSSSGKQTGTTYVSADVATEHAPVDDKGHTIVIGNDVWIGYRATILEGVTIGDGAIIGAGALVNKNIPPYAIAVGIPAKVIKYRFSDEEIKALLEFKWWERSEEWLKANADAFSDNKKLFELIKCDSKAEKEL